VLLSVNIIYFFINGEKNEPVKNTDLWKRLLKAKEPHQVTFIWVKGHDGHPQNERCDILATTAADGSGLLDDVELESGKNEQLGLGDILK